MMTSALATFDLYLFPPIVTLTPYILGLLPALMTTQMFWTNRPHLWFYYSFLAFNMTGKRIKMTRGSYMKGFHAVMSSLFTLILTLNMWGGAPFTISLTSHMMITMFLGFNTWLALILPSIFLGIKPMSAHYLPENAPSTLAYFLALVETLSSIIRPVTLSFRLAANISAGHVILGMLVTVTSFSSMNPSLAMLSSLVLTMGYIMFELTICFVQAFVFFLLSNMYTSDYFSLVYNPPIHFTM